MPLAQCQGSRSEQFTIGRRDARTRIFAPWPTHHLMLHTSVLDTFVVLAECSIKTCIIEGGLVTEKAAKAAKSPTNHATIEACIIEGGRL